MRYIPWFVLAIASVAAAQTSPTPRPSTPRPPVSPAPRAKPRPQTLIPGQDAPLPFEHWELFDRDIGPLGEMSLTLPPLDLSFQLTPFAYQWSEPIGPVMELDQGLLSRTMPMPSLHGLQDIRLSGAPWPSWGDEAGQPRGQLTRMQPDQGTPEDSMYRAAREALNRGEYSRASTMFRTLEQKYPRSRVAPAVLYWQAFALYRAGSTDELKRALEVLKAQQERYPDAAADVEAATLRTRLQAALAARGDAGAAEALRLATAGGPTCDREDVEVRAEALNALAQINPPEARPTLQKVLARRDECSVRLRRSAVYILGRIGTDESTADLIEAAKTDPDPSVRNDAILLIGRSPGATTVKTLEQLFAQSTDDRTKQAVLSALRSRGGPEARRVLRTIIERNDIPEKMRTEAISQLAGGSADVRRALVEANSGQAVATTRRADEDAAYLRNLYAKTESATVKAAIISSVARIGGNANDRWVLGIARNREEDMRLRREALSRLRSTSLSVDDLGKLFDSLSERELRSAVIYQLASREDDAAVDKLIEIAKSGTDPQTRREAISALARKKDPRTTKLLLDLVERP
jgi:HEAT repeat protein